jgi:hypothetical protein
VDFTVYIWNKGRMPVTVEGVAVARLRWRWHFSWWLTGGSGLSAEVMDRLFPRDSPDAEPEAPDA